MKRAYVVCSRKGDKGKNRKEGQKEKKGLYIETLLFYIQLVLYQNSEFSSITSQKFMMGNCQK